MAANTFLLETTHLTVQRGAATLLQGLTWSVQVGECWGILGRNGVGKSTLLQVLAGLQPYHHGHVHYGTEDLRQKNWRKLARCRAYLPQQLPLNFGFRVHEVVAASAPDYDGQVKWDTHVAQALVNFSLEPLAHRDLRALSGGERQRVALAALQAQNVPLWLLDEPTTALDLSHQVQLAHRLRQHCQQGAAVMVSHDLNFTAQLVSHVLLLHANGQWQAGTASDLLNAAQLGHCLGHPLQQLTRSPPVFSPIWND